MAWIESHQSLGRHPKTKQAARALGISRVQLVGHLHYLWWWALDFAEDGNLSDHSADDIAEEAMWEGDPCTFIDALVDAGFLNADQHINDWDDYTGRLRDQREKNRERQRRFRERHRDSNADETLPNAGVTVTSPLRNGATVPNQTRPDHTEPNTKTDGADAPKKSPDYSVEFEQFWMAYPSGHGVKKTTYAQWKRLKPDDLMRRKIMTGLERWKQCERWQNGFVKSAHLWLRDRWWENDPPPAQRAVANGAHLNTPDHDTPFDFFAE